MMIQSKESEKSGLPGFMHVLAGSLTRMNNYLFFLYIFIYHILVVLQGIDFNDEGFHLAFYQQIFNDPGSVTYAFWGWLSGIVGGSFLKLFPFSGIFGIRFLGAFVSTAAIIIAFNLLKKYVHNGYLKVSMILLCLFINEDAKNLYYNNLSAFLYFVVAYFVFIGLRDSKKWMLFAGGFFAGLNIFTRLPNVLGVGLVMAFIYYGFITKKTVKDIVVRSCIFIVGILGACLMVFVAMKLMNHYNSFIESVKMLSSTSQHAKQDDGANGAYGLTHLLKVNFDDYISALRFLLRIGIPVLLIVFINQATSKSSKYIRTAVRVFNYLVTAAAFGLAITGWFTGFRLLELFTSVSLISALVLFNRKLSPDYRLLAFIGGLILFIHPFGSSAGIATVIVYSMWISFPIALDYLMNLKWIIFELRIDTSVRTTSVKGSFQGLIFRNLKWVLICLISLGCLYNVIKYPYLCDHHDRWTMRYSVDNKLMWGVFTSKARADTLDELLKASAKYIQPNDVVLAYDCMPLYHFMTETKSYVRNPCIWFYTTSLFQQELNYAETHQTKLPVIVRQLIKTTGEGSAWPETRPPEDYLIFKRTQGKNNILNDFIKRHGYSEVYNNGDFEILVPR